MRTLAAGAVAGAASTAASSAGAAAPLAAQGASIGLGIKLFGAALVILATAGGVLLQRAGSPDPAAAPPAASIGVAAARDLATTAAAKVDGAIEAPARVAVEDPAAPAPPSEASALEKPIAAAPPAPRIAASEPVELDEAESVTPVPAPVPVPAPAPAAAPQPAIADEDPLAAETRRLREAHGALQAGDAQKALGLLGEQGGQLGEERAAARVLALCQLGKIAEMEAARAAFLRDHPRSPLADRVRGGCATSSPITR
jgi:hypothetical protein